MRTWDRISSGWNHCRRLLLAAALTLLAVAGYPRGGSPARAGEAAPGERHLLYVAAPGIRDYLEFGGAGILVFDMDNGHAFVKRIETAASREAKPDNMKGICASARTGKLYFTTPKKLYCLDLRSEQTLWGKEGRRSCPKPLPGTFVFGPHPPRESSVVSALKRPPSTRPT
jgi:hypothetical protein